jgi:hypothetical protein
MLHLQCAGRPYMDLLRPCQTHAITLNRQTWFAPNGPHWPRTHSTAWTESPRQCWCARSASLCIPSGMYPTPNPISAIRVATNSPSTACLDRTVATTRQQIAVDGRQTVHFGAVFAHLSGLHACRVPYLTDAIA